MIIISNSELNQNHRFVAVYRLESREIKGAGEEWRGWVMKVSNGPEGDGDAEASTRVWFRDLDELPAIMRNLLGWK